MTWKLVLLRNHEFLKPLYAKKIEKRNKEKNKKLLKRLEYVNNKNLESKESDIRRNKK